MEIPIYMLEPEDDMSDRMQMEMAEKTIICPVCKGSGIVNGGECAKCWGLGKIAEGGKK